MSYLQITVSNKYRAKKQEYDGKWYHSRGEAAYAQELDWREKAGEIKSWERQVKIELKVNGILITNYYVDFLVVTKDGTRQYHEYKGYKTADFILKWRLFQALIDEIDPGAELVLIQHKSNYKPKRR